MRFTADEIYTSIGSILISGTSYSLRKYVQVCMIIGSTVMVNMAKSKKADPTKDEASITSDLPVHEMIMKMMVYYPVYYPQWNLYTYY